MSSRKSSRGSSRSSSRRSSRKSSSNQGMDMPNIQSAINTEIAKDNKKSVTSRVPGFIFTLALYGSILYYLYNLEDADCNCIRDWRHNFIKAMCLIIIFLTFVGLFGWNMNSASYKWLAIIYIVLLIINVYAFFTYIGDLNDTQCACAVKKQPNLNSIMNLLRWVYIIIIGLVLFALIAFIVLGYSLFKSISGK
jgi:glucan phosphoethanolaminetransferase (alkaline phosphatase superfamily)